MEDQKERKAAACLGEDELLAENVRLYPVQLHVENSKRFQIRKQYFASPRVILDNACIDFVNN